MTKFTIELPDTFTVSMRNGASVEFATKGLTALGVELLTYGINQKVRDSASGASGEVAEAHEITAKEATANFPDEVRETAQRMMESTVAELLNGEWSMRGDGTGADPRTVVVRSVVRKYAKAKVGAKSPEWATFTGLSTADQNAKLDANYEANKEVFDPLVDEELARRAAAAKAKAKIASSITVNL